MNEISTNTLAIRHTAEKSAEAKAKPVDGGNVQKEQAQQVVAAERAAAEDKKAEQLSQARLDQAVSHMNDFIQGEQRDLRFQIDESSGETVISVLERGTGDLIRQIPNEDFLKLARQAKNHEPINLIATNS